MGNEKKKIEEVVYAYSRQEAIEDGALVDVSKMAQEAGFKIPTVITAGVHELCTVPESLEGMQDYDGRLWDTLWMAVSSFRAKKKSGASEHDMELVEFAVMYTMDKPRRTDTVKLWLCFNKFEGFTIMRPEEY